MADLDAAGATVLAVSADPLEESEVLVAELGLTFPIASDPELVAIGRFGVREEEGEISVPAVFVITSEGDILYKQVGESMMDRADPDEILRVLSR